MDSGGGKPVGGGAPQQAPIIPIISATVTDPGKSPIPGKAELSPLPTDNVLETLIKGASRILEGTDAGTLFRAQLRIFGEITPEKIGQVAPSMTLAQGQIPPDILALLSGNSESISGQIEAQTSTGFNATALIQGQTLDQIVKELGFKNEAEVREVLENMGPGQKYDPTKWFAQAEQVGNKEGLMKYLATAKGKVWFMNKRPAIENMMMRGIPLGVAIGSLFGLVEITDLLGIENPALRLAFIVKGAGLASMPAQILLDHVYRRAILKMPFDTIAVKEMQVEMEGGNALLKLSLPSKATPFSKIKQMLLSELAPAGATLAEKAGRIVFWFPKVTFHMGEGVFFSNLAMYLWGGKDANGNDKVSPHAMEWINLGAFFAREVGDALTGGAMKPGGGYFSKLLNWTPVRTILEPLAMANGVFFTAQIYDYGALAMFNGKGRADYIESIAYRAYEQYPLPSSYRSFFNLTVGEGTGAHLCSGRGFGALNDALDWIWVATGVKSEEMTCSHVRQQVWEDDLEMTAEAVPMIKEQMKAILLTAGSKEGMTSDEMYTLWAQRIDAGWFKQVDIDPVTKFKRQFIDPIIAKNIRAIGIIRTPIVDEMREVFSDELWDLKSDKETPVCTTIVEKPMANKFLEWIGGDADILKKRKQMFLAALVDADIKRVAGTATPTELKLLDLGVKAGFVDTVTWKKPTDKGVVEEKDYKFVHDQDYYEIMANTVLIFVAMEDPQAVKRLQAYAQQKFLSIVLTETLDQHETGRGSVPKETFVTDYFADLKILNPDILFGNTSADEKQQYLLAQELVKPYMTTSPAIPELRAAMTKMAENLKKLIQTQLAQQIVESKTLGTYFSEQCLSENVLGSANTYWQLQDAMSACGNVMQANVMKCSLDYYADKDQSGVYMITLPGGFKQAMSTEDVQSVCGNPGVQNLPMLLKAYQAYVGESNSPYLEGAILPNGSFASGEALLAFTGKELKKTDAAMTAKFAFSPDDLATWVNKTHEESSKILTGLKDRLGRQWIASVIMSASNGEKSAQAFFSDVIAEPYNASISANLKQVATNFKLFWEKFPQLIALDKEFGVRRPSYLSQTDADIMWRTITTGVITRDGNLGNKTALDIWMAEDAIKIAKTKIEEFKPMLKQLDSKLIEENDKLLKFSAFEVRPEAAQYTEQITAAKKAITTNIEFLTKQIEMIKRVIAALDSEVARLDGLRKGAGYPYTVMGPWVAPDAAKPDDKPKTPEFNDTCEPKQEKKYGAGTVAFDREPSKATGWHSIM